MPAVLRLSLRALLALVLVPVAHAVQTPAFSVRGGTVWVSGQQNELTFQPAGASPQTVWKNENPLERGAQVGDRLVLNNWDTLAVFPADSWKPRVTTLPSAVTALAASTDTALAFTSEQVWRLKPDGTWSQHPTGLKDHIIDLAHHRGTWVAVGSTIGESVSPDDAGPDRQNWPHWERSELQRRIYWSTDGLTWKPAQLPPPAEGDPYGQIVAVAGHAGGWLALGAEGDTYTSKDSRTWQPASSLSDITPNTRLHLHALGARFWAQVTNEAYSHDWLSTTDGKTWSPVPLAPGASIVALYAKGGEVHAVGTRKSGRGYETAPVAAFGETPPPNEAEEPARQAAQAAPAPASTPSAASDTRGLSAATPQSTGSASDSSAASDVAPKLEFFNWPVPTGAKPTARPPSGAVRLIHDPAVEREARDLAARLTRAGLALTTTARPLPRTALLNPVLTLAPTRTADLGTFLWHVAPEQMVTLHAAAGIPADELRLHAPSSPPSLAQGEVWILTHPARVAEARAIEAKLKPFGGPQTLVEISVGWRAVTAPGEPSQTVHAPDPHNPGLQQILRDTGVADPAAVIPLRLRPDRIQLMPDLVIVLRGKAGDAPRGLSAAELTQLGTDGKSLLVIAKGTARKFDDTEALAGYALWAAPSAPSTPATGAAPTPSAVAATILAEPAGAREGALERLRLKDVSQTLTDVAHVAGFYVATGDKGTLFFSADARQWEPVKVSGGAGLGRALHDGRAWFVPSRQTEWGLFRSGDRRTWTLNRHKSSERRSLIVRDGQFWRAGFGLGLATFSHGRLDAPAAEGDFNDWDGQIGQWSNSPFAVFPAGDRLGLVTEKGGIFTSDNGDYWERVGRHSFTKPDVVTYAAGNGVELLAAWKFDARGSAELLAHTGDGAWRSVALPFRNLAGLAYGLGRFVALGTTRVDGQWDFYESTDGAMWKSVGSVGATPGDLTFGPAGFLATGANGSLALYNPAPLPAKPMPPRPPTPIPPVTFPDYATGDAPASTSKGRGPRPLSAEERATDELRSLVSKAEAGDVVAKRTLAFAMSSGGRANSNPWRAELWFKDALAAGDPQAGRGYAVLLRQWKPDTPFSRFEELHQASADRGDETAKTWVAQRKTYVANLAQAQAGDPVAIMAVAPLLIAGDVVDADRTKALDWVYGAAEKNHAPALRFLLQNHAQELAAKVEPPRRTLSDATYLKFLTQLADTGDMPALRELATSRASGANGIPKDDALAYAAALKLAQLGDAEAMTFVGGALLDGRGVAKDEAAGRTWITQAADKGNAAAKLWLAQQAAVAERAKTRPPLDGRITGLTPEVFAALELIQSAAVADLTDADSWALAKAVWADAEYSIIEEDLAQELAAAARPLALAAADGRTLSFTKRISAASAAGFAQVFPIAYQPGNAQYHTALWQRTSSAGVLVALARQSPQMKAMVQQAVAQELWGMLNQPAPKDKEAILAYTKQLMESDAAASPTVQKEFRALLRSAYTQARMAAGQTGKPGFIGMGKLPWD